MKKAKKLIDEVLEKIIMAHEHDTNKQQAWDFVDELLSLVDKPINPQDDNVYITRRTNIKAILLELISAAFDTSATAVDSILSELIRNPRVMKKLQDELQSVIGMDRIVEEKDLRMLGYLDKVAEEGFRLHPVSPFMVPRECIRDTTIERLHTKESKNHSEGLGNRA